MNVVMTSWNKLLRSTRDNYRPELHYMRGPGPKWREKHPHERSLRSQFTV